MTAEREALRIALLRKLSPARFPDMSGKMAALVGYVLNAEFTEPVIININVTDGLVLAQHQGDVGFSDVIGAAEDLYANWAQLLEVTLDLTDEERQEAQRLFVTRISRRP